MIEEGNNLNLALMQLQDYLGQAASPIIEEYTQWYIWSSCLWGFVGLILMNMGTIGNVWKHLTPEAYEDKDNWLGVVRLILILLGLFIVADNWADLLAPRAIAIHRLIMDVKP